MMENSPDPGETEEEEEEETGDSLPPTNPSLLEEIRVLSMASNNNCSYEGTPCVLISDRQWGRWKIDYGNWMRFSYF